MGSINLADPVNGTKTDASVIAANNSLIESLLNGGLDDNNIALAAAIQISKLKNFPNDVSKVLRGDGSWLPTATSELDYKQITANVTVSATTEAGATPVVTGNSVTYDGTRVKIEFFAPRFTTSGGATTMRYVLLRDSTVLGWIGETQRGANAPLDQPTSMYFFDTPPAGAHVYALKAFVTVAATSMVINSDVGGPGKLVPAFLRVTRA